MCMCVCVRVSHIGIVAIHANARARHLQRIQQVFKLCPCYLPGKSDLFLESFVANKENCHTMISHLDVPEESYSEQHDAFPVN